MYIITVTVRVLVKLKQHKGRSSGEPYGELKIAEGLRHAVGLLALDQQSYF